MFDIIDYANCKKVSREKSVCTAVLFMNLPKAFDSLKWSFIFKMLNFYGFDSTIIN